MPVLKGRELRIVGFLCNWCSYGGADTAGVGRFEQPTDLRIIRVPCSGRVDPLFVAKALFNGADGVLVSGCHPRDCHYSVGNLYARRRLELLREFLPALGIDPARFEYTWVSASEGQRWKNVVSSFTARIHELGPAPGLMDAAPYLPPAGPDGSGPRPAAGALPRPGADAPAASLAELRERIRAALPELDCVIGWQQGFDALHTTPLFMRTPEDVDRLVWGPLNVHNLATYLPRFKGRKVGVVVKGCDSRSVIELMQEKLIDPAAVRVFGLACSGVADPARLQEVLARAAAGETPAAVAQRGDQLLVALKNRVHEIPLAAVAAEKCLSCPTPLPLLGENAPAAPALSAPEPASPGLEMLDRMTLEQRRGFWRAHMEHCQIGRAHV